jgi:hypothetical protein
MRTWLALGGALSVALAVGATPAFARGHSGGHGGGSHSGHGHARGRTGGSHASSGSHARARPGDSGASSHAGEHPRAASAEHASSGRSRPPLTDAERRHPRPGTGTGDRFFRSFGDRLYARPYAGFGYRYGYGQGYFSPFLYGYDDYGDSPWFYDYRPYPTDRDGEDVDGATLQLDIRPADASIYVDDEFRGSASEATRLELRPGRHRIEAVRPGYRTVTREVDIPPGESWTLDLDLEPIR